MHARIEQFNFLSGFLGGRQYYLEKQHHMNVKAMHAHVTIAQQHAECWFTCMDMTTVQLELTGASIDKVRQSFRNVAEALVNQPN